MSHRRQDEDVGLDLDVYGDSDEATGRRSGSDAGLEHYEEDDAPTLPWTGRVN